MFRSPSLGRELKWLNLVVGGVGSVAAVLQMVDPVSPVGTISYFAIRLSKKRITPTQVIESIESLLGNTEAKVEINKFRQQLESWDGPSNAVKMLHEITSRL